MRVARAHEQVPVESQILQRILPQAERHGLGTAEFFALSMLGIRDGRSAAELDSLVSYTGVRVTAQAVARLAELGLIETGADGQVEELPADGKRRGRGGKGKHADKAAAADGEADEPKKAAQA